MKNVFFFPAFSYNFFFCHFHIQNFVIFYPGLFVIFYPNLVISYPALYTIYLPQGLLSSRYSGLAGGNCEAP
jgi:hypothetical protein